MLKDKGGAAAAAGNFSGSKQTVLETVVNKPVGGVEQCPPAESALFLLVAFFTKGLPSQLWNSGLEGKEQKGVLFVTSKPFSRMWQSPLASFFFGSQFSTVDCKHRHNSGEGLSIFYKVLD